eukprot:1160196-Pelagomonas_calceolata.AAC.4
MLPLHRAPYGASTCLLSAKQPLHATFNRTFEATKQRSDIHEGLATPYSVLLAHSYDSKDRFQDCADGW